MGKVNIISVIVSVTLVGLVLGLSSYNEQAEAGLIVPFGDPCDSGTGVQQHWDKIIFKTDRRLFNDFPPPFSQPILFPVLTYDIKVVQDPISVTLLERAVSSFLNVNGYRTEDGSSVKDVFIIIVDVEYEIACVSTGLMT